MQAILELCVALDTRAATTYDKLADVCTDEEVRLTFQRMGAEEVSHVMWWTELLEAWKTGLVPDVADESSILGRLQELAEEIEMLVPGEFSDLSTDQMLDLAAHMEFFMLDPVFGELLVLVNPGSSTEHREAYSRHVMRLVNCIESHYSRTDLAHFLARVLARSFHDQQRLATLAMHDPLTGLYNRRGFYGYVRQWTSWSTRYGRPLGILLVDIDRFKSINDEFGHPQGDDALRLISAALCQAVRTSDVVGRYGGDEFAILAPETDAEELVGLMNRIINVVRDTPFAVGKRQVRLSVSVGGAMGCGTCLITPERLLAAADHSLYEAKTAGRDQAGVVVVVEQEI